jgi:hypothetical protein
MFWQDETDIQDTPEVRLWRAVIDRAIQTAFTLTITIWLMLGIGYILMITALTVLEVYAP